MGRAVAAALRLAMQKRNSCSIRAAVPKLPIPLRFASEAFGAARAYRVSHAPVRAAFVGIRRDCVGASGDGIDRHYADETLPTVRLPSTTRRCGGYACACTAVAAIV